MIYGHLYHNHTIKIPAQQETRHPLLKQSKTCYNYRINLNNSFMEKGPAIKFGSEKQTQKEAPEALLKERGWTAERLKQAQELILKLAETGRAIVNALSIKEVSPDGVDLDQSETQKIEVLFSKDAQKALTAAATALAAGGAILTASPAFAGIQKDTITQTGEVVKTYTLPPGTQQFEVLAGGESLDIGSIPGYTSESANGHVVYHPIEPTSAPATLSIKLNVPANKQGTELTVKTNTSHDDDLQLFEGAGGKIRWIIGGDASQSANLDALASIEGSLISHKEEIGEKENGWRMPVGLRIMQGQPDTHIPVTLGLSAGLALWDSNKGEISGEIGTTFDPKTLRSALGREALLALSYSKDMGKLEIHASSLSTLGNEGKTAADIGVDLETKRLKTPAGDVVLSSGLGLSTEGWDITKGTAEKSLLHIRPVKVTFPFLGQEVTLAPSITRDMYRGDTGGSVDMSVQPEKK